MTKVVTATDFMVRKVVSIGPEANVEEAISCLLKNKISGMPVVDDGGKLVGIISERDCLKTFVNGRYHKALPALVKDVMSTTVTSVDPDTDIIQIAELFLKNKYRRLPVMDGSKLVGQVSRRDVLKAIDAVEK